MKRPGFLVFSLLALGLLETTATVGSALGADHAIKKMDESALEAYNSGDYRRAENGWSRLADRLNITLSRTDDKKELTQILETCQRHLGECAAAQKKYDLADEYFTQARNNLNALGEQDAELDRDIQSMSANYKIVDLNNLTGLGPLAPFALAALGDFRPNKVAVAMTDTGHHVTILLAEDVIKQIGRSGVTEVGVSKKMSFDMTQGNGGEVTLSNIEGVKVHATVWVNIVNACIKTDESQQPVAVVTAQKMGISQSVKTNVPQMIYMPVMSLASQVKNLFTGGSAAGQTIIASPDNTQTSGATGYGIAPVWNNGDPGNAGAVVPLPAAMRQYPEQFQQQQQPQFQQQQQYPGQPQYQQQ